MAQLEVSERPAHTLREVAPWFWRHVPKAMVVIGGGTILAARWNHRVSTDIDLFASDGFLTESVDEQMLHRAANANQSDMRLTPTSLYLTTESKGSLSISCNGFRIRRQQGETIDGIAAMPTTDILVLKMRDRVGYRAQLVVRDMYDFAIAAVLDPPAMSEAERQIPLSDKKRIAQELQDVPSDFWSQPLIAPTCRALADRIIERSVTLFASGAADFRNLYGDEIRDELGMQTKRDQGPSRK